LPATDHREQGYYEKCVLRHPWPLAIDSMRLN
jgi:hypothetical protein